MSAFLRATAIGALILAALVALVTEGVSWLKGSEWRLPLYWGGAAGFGLNLIGYPFALKMAVLPAEKVKAGASINWWVGGVLARLVGLAIFIKLLKGRFGDYERFVVMMTIGVYMAGMLAELAWLGRRFNAMDTK